MVVDDFSYQNSPFEPASREDSSWITRPYSRPPYFANCEKAEWEKYIEWLNERRKMREEIQLSSTAIWVPQPSTWQRRNQCGLEQRTSREAPDSGAAESWQIAPPPGREGGDLENELREKQESFRKREEKRLEKKSSRKRREADRLAHRRNRRKREDGHNRRSKKRETPSVSSSSESANLTDSEDEKADDVVKRIEAGDVVEVSAATSNIGASSVVASEVTEENPADCNVESDEDHDIGPRPLDATQKLSQQAVDYGGALRPGEGEAMAQFVQAGKRIPRRGEVGLTADQIEEFEDLGYVMSGSRHRRMNAVRIRKENQVYSAEEQRALAMYNFEERANRETQLISDLREMLKKQNEAIFAESISEKLSAKK